MKKVILSAMFLASINALAATPTTPYGRVYIEDARTNPNNSNGNPVKILNTVTFFSEASKFFPGCGTHSSETNLGQTTTIPWGAFSHSTLCTSTAPNDLVKYFTIKSDRTPQGENITYTSCWTGTVNSVPAGMSTYCSIAIKVSNSGNGNFPTYTIVNDTPTVCTIRTGASGC